MDVKFFDGEHGEAIIRSSGDSYHFYAQQIKRCDQRLVVAGAVILVTPNGYIEESTASFMRFYPNKEVA